MDKMLRELREEVGRVRGRVPAPGQPDPSHLSLLDHSELLRLRRFIRRERGQPLPEPAEDGELSPANRRFYEEQIERKGPIVALAPLVGELPRDFLREQAPELLRTGPLSEEEWEEATRILVKAGLE